MLVVWHLRNGCNLQGHGLLNTELRQYTLRGCMTNLEYGDCYKPLEKCTFMCVREMGLCKRWTWMVYSRPMLNMANKNINCTSSIHHIRMFEYSRLVYETLHWEPRLQPYAWNSEWGSLNSMEVWFNVDWFKLFFFLT